MSDKRVTIVIADDHPVYRRGLARAIADRPDLELAGEAEDGRTALALIEQTSPAVAVLDISMPGLDGIQVLKAVRRDARPTAVLLLSGSTHAEGTYGVIAAGAAGYLLKTAEHETICDAIRACARGDTAFSPELHDSLASEIRSRETRPLLSPREIEILRLTASGSGAAAIAEALHLSIATVRTHIQNGYQKLGVSDRAAAVAAAMRLGLIE
ncbi:MAG TPA: response regulator transcription factor [Solirubrobacteraceae bacterium]|nr:response regulator transcription factor [Solirubrobacteraceae bacterium]